MKVVSSVKEESGRTRVNLSNGTDMVVDVYIDATGGRPNSDFLPKEWLDERGRVLTDGETLRGTGQGMEGVYAIGDVASYSSGGAPDVNFATKPLGTSIGIDIVAQLDSRTEKAQSNKTGGKPPKALVQIKYKPLKDTQMVPVGRSGGVFEVFGWRLPSWMVWSLKSRDFMVGWAAKTVSGADFLKP